MGVGGIQAGVVYTIVDAGGIQNQYWILQVDTISTGANISRRKDHRQETSWVCGSV